MKVIELQEILANYHPQEEVGVRSASNRNMTFLGIDKQLTASLGHLVLKVDFTIKDKPVEDPRDILLRQEAEIKEAIKRMDKAEVREAAKIKKRKSKKNRTAAQKLADGFIPTSKPGRPRKIVTEEELMAKQEKGKRGRRRKETTAIDLGIAAEPEPAEISQLFSQSDLETPFEPL